MNKSCFGCFFTLNGWPGYRCLDNGKLVRTSKIKDNICPECEREIQTDKDSIYPKTRFVKQVCFGGIWENMPEEFN